MAERKVREVAQRCQEDDEAVEEVIATLNDYAGTVVVVSHSRAFLQAVHATRYLQLSSKGLAELSSLEEFVDLTADSAQRVVAECFQLPA